MLQKIMHNESSISLGVTMFYHEEHDAYTAYLKDIPALLVEANSESEANDKLTKLLIAAFNIEFKAGAAFTQSDWHYVERDGLPEDDGNLVHIAFHWPDDPAECFTNLARIGDGEWLDSEGDKFCFNTKWVIYAWRCIESSTPPPLKP